MKVFFFSFNYCIRVFGFKTEFRLLFINNNTVKTMSKTQYELLQEHFTLTQNKRDKMYLYYFLIKCSTHCDEPKQEITNSGCIKLLVVKTAIQIDPESFETGKYIRFTPLRNGSSGGFLLAKMSQECFDAYYLENSAVKRKDEDILAAKNVYK